MLNSILLAISSSIDSLGIGLTFGIRNTKISNIGKIIIFVISIAIAFISITLGNFIQKIFPNFLTKLIASSILIAIGLYICFKSKKDKESSNYFNNPMSSDLDNSNTIDSKESVFLAIALSLDSFSIGICGSILDANLFLFPLFVSIFQLAFLILGIFIGNRFSKKYKLPQNTWSLISGIILIFIGIVNSF